jgi:cbb3-type cytochrome oxidase maturation protein
MAITLVQFTVALFMSLGALCIFIWAALSGFFTDVEGIADRVYRAEADDEQPDRA